MNNEKLYFRIKENSFLAKLGAIKLGEKRMALTLGKTIHLYNVSKDTFFNSPSWVCHELQHIEQCKKMGIIKFLWKYMYYSARYGYFNNPLEIEARAAERDIALLAKYDVERFSDIV